MAGPLTTSSSLEARKAAIDTQAVTAVAASPTFIASLNLPPIPASTPPLERRELEARRTELLNQLVWAAARGDESGFRTVLEQLKPGASDLTAGAAYGSARMAFLETRGTLLETECVTSLSGTDRAATTYWMRQLARNTQERFNMDPQGMATSTTLFEGTLRRMAGRIPGKPGETEYNRRMEMLLESAIDAGFPAREVFATARARIGDAMSPSHPGNSIIGNLLDRAYLRASALFAECAKLYGQQETSTGQVDFSRKYAEFRRLTAGLLTLDPELHFDQEVFARPAERGAFMKDLLFHMQISADAVFVP